MKRPKRTVFLLVSVASCVVAFCAIAILPFLDDVRSSPLVLVVAMRRLIAAGALIVGTISTSVLVVRSRGRRRILAAVALSCCLILTIPWSVGAIAGSTGRALGNDREGGISIFSWNTGQVAVDDFVLQDALEKSDADIIVLPEYFQQVATAKLTDWANRSGYAIYSTEASTSSILVRTSLGAYKVDTSGVPPWAGFVLRPQSPSNPSIVAVHVERPFFFSDVVWNRHLDWVSDACADPNVIAIGDFNAAPENLRAGKLGSCVDAATRLGSTGTTWPAAIPSPLGTQIDRVLTGRNWQASDFAVISGYDTAGSDHRPIVATVNRDAL